MSARKCWTCGSEHDLDEACHRHWSRVNPARVPTDGELLFATPEESRLGPVIVASYDGDDACCGNGIWNGERIRADGERGWVHEECAR